MDVAAQSRAGSLLLTCDSHNRIIESRVLCRRRHAENRDRFIAVLFACHADIFFKMIYTEITAQQSESARII